MSAPTSRAAYEAEFDLLDRAVASERGVQRLFTDRGAAFQFRTRLHKARSYDQEDSKKIYERTDPQWNSTPYACIIVREPFYEQERGVWVLRLEKNSIEHMVVEDIPAYVDVEFEEVFADATPKLEGPRRI